MRSANRRLTAWMFRHPWQWALFAGASSRLAWWGLESQNFGVAAAAGGGIGIGVFTTLIQGVLTQRKAAGAWNHPAPPGRLLTGCRVALTIVAALVIGVILLETFSGPAPALGGALLVIALAVIIAVAVVWEWHREV